MLMSAKSSSGKSRFTFVMFEKVKVESSPANGEQVVNMTYVRTPRDHMSVYRPSGS
jgi:hypothetical protein